MKQQEIMLNTLIKTNKLNGFSEEEIAKQTNHSGDNK